MNYEPTQIHQDWTVPMLRINTLVVTTLVALGVQAQVGCSEPPDESKEPPIRYSLKIGDKRIQIVEGVSVRLDGEFANPEVVLEGEPDRVFPYQGITFRYPRTFGFEADLSDPQSKTWTLSGNDFKIMLFAMRATVSAKDLSNVFVDKFGKEQCKITEANAKLTLGKHNLAGTNLRVTIAGHKMAMQVYQLASNNERTLLLVLQDNLDDSGKSSPESRQSLEMLRASFRLEP